MAMTPEDALSYAIGFTNSKVKEVKEPINWIGITTTEITNGDDTNPIEINGEEVTVSPGDVVKYGSTEFIFGKDELWQTYTENIYVEDSCLYFG